MVARLLRAVAEPQARDLLRSRQAPSGGQYVSCNDSLPRHLAPRYLVLRSVALLRLTLRK